jgi:single-strand DNA-binding protein
LRCLASSKARKGDFVGNDAELKSTKNETAVAVFSVATQRSWKNHRGGYDSRTEWHRCLAWGKLSKFASALKKGAHVQVEGELRYREYEKDHGTGTDRMSVTHRVAEICVSSILELDRAEKQDEPASGVARSELPADEPAA